MFIHEVRKTFYAYIIMIIKMLYIYELYIKIGYIFFVSISKTLKAHEKNTIL